MLARLSRMMLAERRSPDWSWHTVSCSASASDTWPMYTPRVLTREAVSLARLLATTRAVSGTRRNSW